jgi:hypothetical protein
MKRALTAAVFGGLVLFFVPQAAQGSARPVAPADHNAEHKGGDCAGQAGEAGEAGQPEGSSETEKAPPRQGDREQRDGDDGSELF